jgi:pilus assembly protein CpaB
VARRTALLIAAALVALLGTTLVFLYVQGVDDRALADQEPKQVLVAKTAIPAGTSAEAASASGAFELRDIAASAVAPSAIADIGALSGQVALTPIFPGEQILSEKFGAAGDTASLPIPAGKMAVSVQLSDPARVAGFVQPGSNVAVFVSLTGPEGDFTRVLLPRAQVIAVGPTTTVQTTTDEEGNTEALPRAILTLALDQTESQRVIYASQKGQLYFGLLTRDSTIDAGEPTSDANLFG